MSKIPNVLRFIPTVIARHSREARAEETLARRVVLRRPQEFWAWIDRKGSPLMRKGQYTKASVTVKG